jgi:HPt (histidine-containing phosphotransfer) domain-containing protein
MNENDVIDRSALERLEEWGGERLVTQMVRLFLENSGQRIEQILGGFEDSDADAVERGAHSLKSSAANVGAQEVRRLAEGLEERASTGDLGVAEELREPLTDAWERACGALREIQSGGS